MGTSRMPFDYGEAESELVTGSSTDLSSVNFSISFLTEILEFLLACIILVLMACLHGTMGSISVVCFTLICYLPRLLHCRAYVTDVLRIAVLLLL